MRVLRLGRMLKRLETKTAVRLSLLTVLKARRRLGPALPTDVRIRAGICFPCVCCVFMRVSGTSSSLIKRKGSLAEKCLSPFLHRPVSPLAPFGGAAQFFFIIGVGAHWLACLWWYHGVYPHVRALPTPHLAPLPSLLAALLPPATLLFNKPSQSTDRPIFLPSPRLHPRLLAFPPLWNTASRPRHVDPPRCGGGPR